MPRAVRIPIFALLAWAICSFGSAQSLQERFKPRADLRFRLETDYAGLQANGLPRSDRTRARMRGRFGLRYAASIGIELGFRLRTGSFESQQSPHITLWDFDSNPTGDKDVLPDQYYIRVSGEQSWLWIGRNQLPLWKTNELLWDDDVTPFGIGFGHQLRAGPGRLTLNGGVFTPPDGGLKYHNNLVMGQGVYTHPIRGLQLTVGSGVLYLRGGPGAENLRNKNGERRYTIWTSGVSLSTAGKHPLTFASNLHQNLQDYVPLESDDFTRLHRNERTGYDFSLRLGDLSARGRWLAGYTYARVETLAVNASYAQDDWVRWGSATQTDSSDFKGHEIQAGLALSEKLNILGRFYVAQALSNQQEGKRFRLDMNYTFW